MRWMAAVLERQTAGSCRPGADSRGSQVSGALARRAPSGSERRAVTPALCSVARIHLGAKRGARARLARMEADARRLASVIVLFTLVAHRQHHDS